MTPKYDHTEVDDTSIIEERIVMPSTLETIDEAFLQHVKEEFNIRTTTRNGFEEVPVLWLTAERSYQIKNNQNLRDKNGALILPIMTI